jgi:hypothetical protein
LPLHSKSRCKQRRLRRPLEQAPHQRPHRSGLSLFLTEQAGDFALSVALEQSKVSTDQSAGGAFPYDRDEQFERLQHEKLDAAEQDAKRAGITPNGSERLVPIRDRGQFQAFGQFLDLEFRLRAANLTLPISTFDLPISFIVTLSPPALAQ